MQEYNINFLEEDVRKLSNLIEELNNILINTGFGTFIDTLNQIRLAAENKDETNFVKNIINNTLFGGAGALWEIYIENVKIRKEFVEKFCVLIDHFKKMGIEDNRIDQVRQTLSLL